MTNILYPDMADLSKEGQMFQIEVQSESGAWLPVDDPYQHAAIAVDDAIALGQKYDATDHIRVTTLAA